MYTFFNKLYLAIYTRYISRVIKTRLKKTSRSVQHHYKLVQKLKILNCVDLDLKIGTNASKGESKRERELVGEKFKQIGVIIRNSNNRRVSKEFPALIGTITVSI